jgi:uncharacterized beta-barrel protein YwiB (DUF1934 family)
MNMKRVKLQIVTKMQKQQETIKQEAVGTFYPKEGGWYLVYKEQETEVSTTIKAYHDKVTIIRTGAVRMRQEYVKNMSTEGKYEAPYGFFWMKTDTKRIEWKENFLLLRYRLQMNEDDLGLYEVKIWIDDLQTNGGFQG